MSVLGVIALDFHSSTAAQEFETDTLPFVRIAGVELITRQALTLLKGGASQVIIIPGKLEDHVRQLMASDKRFHQQPITIDTRSVDEIIRAFKSTHAQTIVIGADVLISPQFIDLTIQQTSAKRWSAQHALLMGPSAELTLDCDTISSDSANESHPYILNIHSHKDCRRAKREIFRNVTKTTSGWVSKNINSLISLPISKLISPLPITPNILTLLNTLVGIASAVFIAQGHTQGVLMGGILFQLSAAFDRVDGEIARSKFQASPYGSWIDTAGDNITYVAFLIGLTVGCYKRFGNVNYLYAGFALLAIMLVMFAAMYRFLIRKGGSGSLVEVATSFEKKMRDQKKPFIYRSLDKIRFAGKRDFFSLVCMFVCMADQLLILFGCALAVIIGCIAYFTSAMIKNRKNTPLAQQ